MKNAYEKTGRKAIKGKIRVLVVDDSAFMRKALKRMLGSDPMIKVIGDARDGKEAIEKVQMLKPDVVTLDVKMYGMDGLEALSQIMQKDPCPVLMVSSLTSEGGEVTLRALELGAVDFIDKSSCHTHMDILDIGEALVNKVKVIAGVDLKKVKEIKGGPLPVPANSSTKAARPPATMVEGAPSHVVAIGASTGGPMSLEEVLSNLPVDYSGTIFVVQHMPIGFTKSLAERMDKICRISVKEAEQGDLALPARVLIAPGGYHMKLRRKRDGGHYVHLTKKPYDTPHCPSVDVLMQSMAEEWQGRMLGIVMTGMGKDGSEGIRHMKAAGATVYAQDERTCVVFGMPLAASLTGCVDKMVPLRALGDEILKF